MTTRVLLLDVDGVLVTSQRPDGRHPFADIERVLGISWSLLQTAFFDVYWQEIVVGRDALKPRLSAVLGKIAPGLEAQRVIDYWFANDTRIDAEVLADVDALRRGGMKVLLATNQEHLRAQYLMEERGLRAHVDGILYSAALGARKPFAEFYARASERAGVAARDILFVDDAAANVEAARIAGWDAVLWTGAARLREIAGKGYRISCVTSMLRLLNRGSP